MNQIPKKKTLYFLIIMVIVTTITYLNHFDNSFHFDDFHTITENPNIRNLKNIPDFFTDGSTIGSLPQNQSYRPIVTTSLAIDYWLGNGYNIFYFHLLTFILFILQGVLLFFFLHKTLELTTTNINTFYISAGVSLWYMLHPVMAETVNYVIARSDLQATFFVVLTFFFYQYWPLAKKYHLYLIPFILGTLAKPIAIMFAPLLFCYILLFEHNLSFFDLFSKKSFSKILMVIKQSLPAFATSILLYLFILKMTPETYTTGSSNTFNYLITQPWVISYYFGSLFLPIHLSADTDWSPLQSIWSYEFFLSLFVLLSLITIAFIASKKKKHYPIAFGIAWFFIALIPTSSFIPLAEVMNDHRMFFPYIGLIISVGYFIWLVYQWLVKKQKINSKILISSMIVLLGLYSFGTYQRNQVWHDEESLWKDVSIKSPKNGRGLMNYGLTQMAKGEYVSAEKHFKEALKFTPNYHTLHINLGILNNAQGRKVEAEKYFKKAIEYGPNYYNPWFYYGRFLSQNKRTKEAIEKLSKSVELSPYHMETRQLLMENYLDLEEWGLLHELAYSTLQIEKNNKKAQLFLLASIQKIGKLDMEEREVANNPTAEKYINLGLKYYNQQQYNKCIKASEKALALDPNSTIAYNNICISQNLLGNFDKAIEACNKALLLSPDFELAKNNLNAALTGKTSTDELIRSVATEPTEGNYLNLSLLYYNYGLFDKCITIAQEGVTKYPNSDNLYNNICAAYNSLKQWGKAIEVGKKGLEINPNNGLLRNNYNVAINSINKD
ncbi:tetratricopeptide repeat protein [uncultured Aquimarina sp.]|uniref:tetratricopeptide repeat protein n=1 Tax=uncultured Aquimarina sp. TaxID=575652 RepID=UPI002602BB97|nr:tetratricopeptide repeat protein [uncultured Aquimarina sp.]